jgi:cytochrome c biogenesis protein CcdA
MLYGLGAVISFVIAAVCFYWIRTTESTPLVLVIGIVFGILTIVFGGLFLAGRINKTEDIHVTE